MPRIRTVKPELWEDELLGVIPRDARLLFIATFNMADDEGILRWTPAYIKAQAFMYDDDLNLKDVDQLMRCLTDTGLLFSYVGGVAKQQMAVVVNFRKHQRINRPQKGKLPPPALGAWPVREMYARRDGWTCQLCGSDIPQRIVVNDDHNLAIDHIRPVAAGGSDHPSNVRAVHRACGRSRYSSADEEEFIPPAALSGLEDSLNESLNRSVNDSVNESHAQSNFDTSVGTDGDFSSLNHSLMEGKGREQGRERKGTPPTPRQSSSSPTVSQTGERAIEDRMTDAFLERYKAGNAYNARQIRRVIADTLANSTDPDELWAALERLGASSKPVTNGTLQFAFAEIRKQHNPSNVIALASGQTLSGTDATVDGWMALADHFDSKDSA